MTPATPANAESPGFQCLRRLQPPARPADVAGVALKGLPHKGFDGCGDIMSRRLQRPPYRGDCRRGLAGVEFSKSSGKAIAHEHQQSEVPR
jgi:hypothetical protein